MRSYIPIAGLLPAPEREFLGVCFAEEAREGDGEEEPLETW